MYKKYIMNYKEKKLQAILNSPFRVGEKVWVKKKHFDSNTRSPNFHETFFIKSIVGDIAQITPATKGGGNWRGHELPIDKLEKITYRIGYNPFIKTDMINDVEYTLSSLINGFAMLGKNREYKINDVPIKEVNYDPFVYVEGKKEYYQRPLVWTLEYKQNLIESIYQNVECGRVLVRLRSYSQLEKMQKAGETELAFKDIVDGKQRMHTIKEFINNEWPDKDGRHYCELSDYAQRKFGDHKLFSYAEMPESTEDEAVLRQFLKTNINFYPQSPEHLAYVEKLYEKI